MDFVAFAKREKSKIEELLLSYLTTQQVFPKISPWGEDLQNRLKAFVTQGKMMRGTLVLLGYSMFGGTEKKVITAAAALELFHSSFLIHDDIMDQDPIRRNLKTFYKQYQDLAERQQLSNPELTGNSLGICAGDIGFFLGFNLLHTVEAEAEIKQKMLQLITNELIQVGLGQMQDVALGATTETPTEDAILNVYRYKTARYTFSLPLMTGALLAGADEEQLRIIERAGESLGIIFQIKDDELGIFGDEKQIGKPVGSDIRENKKTIYYFLLFQKANSEQQKRLGGIFGNKNMSNEDLRFTRDTIIDLGVKEEIQQHITKLSNEYVAACYSLKTTEEYRLLLKQLFDYTIKRTS